MERKKVFNYMVLYASALAARLLLAPFKSTGPDQFPPLVLLFACVFDPFTVCRR
jgi:hypothetical protein